MAGLGLPEAGTLLAGWRPRMTAWADLALAARRLRVAPLVHAGLRAVATDAPPVVLDTLRRATLAAGARSARLEQTTASVVAAASEDGIPVLILKGLALQHLIYPRGVIRHMDDIDLLVSPSDGPRLGRLLRSRGYRNDFRGEEDFFAPDHSHSIDVHTGLLNTTRLPSRAALWPEPFQGVWRRRQPLWLDGAAAWTLGPQDCIQHLALHAVHHHGMHGVVWLADFLAALRRWPAAIHSVAEGPPAVRRSIWYCLETLAIRGCDPTPAVRSALRPRRLWPGERRALEETRRAGCSAHVRYALTLVCLPGWATKAAFMGQLLCPPRAVYAAGFTDAGPTPRHPRAAHWRNIVHLASRRRLGDPSD